MNDADNLSSIIPIRDKERGEFPSLKSLASDFAKRRYQLRAAGQVVELVTRWDGQALCGGGRRSAVSSFSSQSRRRLFRNFAAIGDFRMLGTGLFITLTYPGDFPLDGRRVKRDLWAFRRAWKRQFGSVVGAWKLEFQARGAPHFHLALVLPTPAPALTVIDGELVEDEAVALAALRLDVQVWCAETWFRIVASGDNRHLLAGTQVQLLADRPAAYFAGYVGGSRGSKEYQHAVPDGFTDVGRFWGFWSLRPEWSAQNIDRQAFLDLRRVAWRLRSSREVRPQRRMTRGRIQSEWLVVDQAAAVFANRCRTWLDLPPLR